MDHVTLTLKPDPDMPHDLPFRAPQIDVPVHPRARPVNADSFAAMGFPIVAYRSRAEAISYALPVEVVDAFAWFDDAFARQGHSRAESNGRTGNTRTGEFTEWMLLSVSPPDNPELIVQLTFRPHDGEGTILTYRAEEHPAPLRDPASYLSEATERIEVQYTFLNGPQRTIDRTVVDRATIRALVNAINALPRDKRAWCGGTFWSGGWADLRVMAPGEPERKVHVDASHSAIIVDGFPGLLGNLWSLLVQLAPPPRGASGIPGMDWEKGLSS